MFLNFIVSFLSAFFLQEADGSSRPHPAAGAVSDLSVAVLCLHG